MEDLDAYLELYYEIILLCGYRTDHKWQCGEFNIVISLGAERTRDNVIYIYQRPYGDILCTMSGMGYYWNLMHRNNIHVLELHTRKKEMYTFEFMRKMIAQMTTCVTCICIR